MKARCGKRQDQPRTPLRHANARQEEQRRQDDDLQQIFDFRPDPDALIKPENRKTPVPASITIERSFHVSATAAHQRAPHVEDPWKGEYLAVADIDEKRKRHPRSEGRGKPTPCPRQEVFWPRRAGRPDGKQSPNTSSILTIGFDAPVEIGHHAVAPGVGQSRNSRRERPTPRYLAPGDGSPPRSDNKGRESDERRQQLVYRAGEQCAALKRARPKPARMTMAADPPGIGQSVSWWTTTSRIASARIRRSAPIRLFRSRLPRAGEFADRELFPGLRQFAEPPLEADRKLDETERIAHERQKAVLPSNLLRIEELGKKRLDVPPLPNCRTLPRPAACEGPGNRSCRMSISATCRGGKPLHASRSSRSPRRAGRRTSSGSRFPT